MDEWVWSNGGMILTGENWSTGRKPLYSVGSRWMNEYGAMVEWYWQGNTEVLGEKHYTVWVVVEWMSMEQWWNDTERGKLKYWENRLSICHFFYHKPQLNWSGIRLWKAGCWPPWAMTPCLCTYQHYEFQTPLFAQYGKTVIFLMELPGV